MFPFFDRLSSPMFSQFLRSYWSSPTHLTQPSIKVLATYAVVGCCKLTYYTTPLKVLCRRKAPARFSGLSDLLHWRNFWRKLHAMPKYWFADHNFKTLRAV